ncbi:tyrosine-type recombinase/integrase [Plantibacter sp. ME-Dv--P-095]
MRFHDMRYTCASLLLAQGVQMRGVMEILGHANMAITSDI